MPTDSFVIQCENLVKSYPLYEKKTDRLKEALHPRRKKYHRDFYALREVSFSVRKGEKVGVVGQNGSGKSTLLKILAGVLTPTSGTVEVKGRVGALLELATGFNPELTGLENLYFAGTLMGLTQEELRAKKDSILAFADIGEFIRQPVKTYSSGMLMRLAFAVQTSLDPDVLIIDEALSVGDIFFQAKCLRRINQMADSGVTVLFVTHSMNTLKELCGRALLLDQGRLLTDSDSGSAVQRYLKISQAAAAVFPEPEKKEGSETVEKSLSSSLTSGPKLKELLDGREGFLANANHDRVLNGQAEYLNVTLCDERGCPASVFEFGQRALCRMVIRVHKPLEALWIGYKIRTPTGVDIVHADSSLQGLLDYPFEAGKTYQAEWSFEMNLSHGSYLLGCALGLPEPLKSSQRVMHLADVVHAAQTFTVQPRREGMVGATVVWENQLKLEEVNA